MCGLHRLSDDAPVRCQGLKEAGRQGAFSTVCTLPGWHPFLPTLSCHSSDPCSFIFPKYFIKLGKSTYSLWSCFPMSEQEEPCLLIGSVMMSMRLALQSEQPKPGAPQGLTYISTLPFLPNVPSFFFLLHCDGEIQSKCISSFKIVGGLYVFITSVFL